MNIGIVEDAVNHPQKIAEGYKGRKIAQKELDLDHVLRVVYEEHANEIVIVTFYPGRKEKYGKDQI